jgi:glucose-1-phosphate adenylyltransferase
VKKILGVVLGGGKGSRLFPLTLIRSKPAVPLGGKYRLVDIPISNCINSGINRIFVLTQFNSESLNRHITQTYRFGLFSQGFVDILAAEQTPENTHWYQGTADAVRQSLRHILTYEPDHILILSGDHLYRMDYRELYQCHARVGADVTVCVNPVRVDQASEFGILRMHGDGRITEFYEKPKDPAILDISRVDVRAWEQFGVKEERPLMASMGIYLFNTEALVKVLDQVGEMDFGRDIIPAALSDYHVQGYVFHGYWADIGTIKAFYESNLRLTAPEPDFRFYEAEAPIYSHPRFLPASRIQSCRLEQSMVSEGCEIRGSSIFGSVIGIRSIIQEGCKLNQTLMMGADFYEAEKRGSVPLGVGEGSVINRTIIDKNARVGAGVTIRDKNRITDFDGPNYYVRDGVVIVPKNGVIEDGTVI